ncbi:MAG: type II toxin-antitoxin system RelE/ParE family toxin [Acidobacteriota bacterium]
MPYEILFARSARRELERLPSKIAERIFNRIEKLSDQPRPRGSVKLRGAANHWRIRAGDYRVIYAVDDRSRIVDVSAIRHRSDAYR